MNNSRLLLTGILLLLVIAVIGGWFHWTVNRVYVEEGRSLMLRYKGPLLIGARNPATPGTFAAEGEIGVLERLRGPGRHFYCPIWWERTIVDDYMVSPGEVALVTSKLGELLPEGQFLVDGDLTGENRAKHKGILRKVFGPGRYRVNPYAYEFKIVKALVEKVGEQKKESGWVDIPTGYVGVVTFLAENTNQNKKIGIQDEVLPPGIYPVNPREQQIDVIAVGFRETSISTKKRVGPGGTLAHDESGEPIAVPESGIGFPSNDGFPIQLDFTAIWGVMPEDAAKIIRTFGSVEQAEQKVVFPQSESICRNNGSKMGAVELLVGETRQHFQEATSKEFEKVLEEKHLKLLYGLVRHIYIPQQIRIPIQNGYIADELKLTREQETLTAKTEADLREAEKKIDLEREKIRTETAKMVASAMAEGEKKSKEIEAETKQQVAAIDREIAEMDAKKKVLLGEATAKAQQLSQEAKAQKFKLAVEAFGSSPAYNRWQFAEGLPETIDLRLFYAGEGTLWTDLKSVLPTLPVAAPKTAEARKP